MGELLQFPDRWKMDDAESGLDKLQTLIQIISGTSHFDNKTDALDKFEKLQRTLIAQGHFASEAAVIQALDARGVKGALDTLELIRAIRQEG